MKKFFIIAIVVVILSGALYFYFQQAQVAIPKAQKFDNLNNAINTEQARCQSFVGSGSGDFGQFEYCKRFLDWSQKVEK